MANNAQHPVGNPVGFKNSSIFGTDGIRGKAGAVLTPDLVIKVGYWVGKMLCGEGPILIGEDSRNSGAMISAALSAGLTAAGKDVWMIGLCPTPAVSFLIKKISAAGGLMVSASHNPPQDNGIKIFGSNGFKITEAEQQEIEDNISNGAISQANNFNSFGKVYKEHNLLADYKSALLSSVKIKSLKGVKIVLDLCWGSATSCGAEVFQALGADNLTVLHGNPNGDLINVDCGSTNLGRIKEAVINKKADMGFAFDGDADRMLAIDSQGRVLDGDHILYLWGQSLYEKNKLPDKRIVATVMSNLGFQKKWETNGGILERTNVGDQNVYEAMAYTGAKLGGEQSGHILAEENNFSGDGLLTALQLTNICQEKSSTLSELLETSFTPFPQKLVNIKLSKKISNKQWKKCAPIQSEVLKAEDYLGENGRILLRPSGTEPLLRVMVEANDPSVVNKLTTHLASVVEEHIEAA